MDMRFRQEPVIEVRKDKEVIMLKEDDGNEEERDDEETKEEHEEEIHDEEVAEMEENRQVAGIEKGVGTDDQVSHIMNLMNINGKDKRLVVVIHGEDIKEATQVLGGLQLLQTKLISDVLKRELEDVAFVNRGIEFFSDSFCNMRVLIVLDDVENAFHIQKLIGDCFDCLASGSRIIVTTRNSVVLEESPQIQTYHVSRLDNDQALQLYRQRASIPTSSSHSNFALPDPDLKAMAGLPLFIEVMGALANDKLTPEDFESMPNIRFLQLDHADIAGDFADVFPNLSKVTEDWEGWDQIEMKNLRVLDLTGCADLLVTPKFSGCKNLAILILERCSQLVEIDHSIGVLKCLVSLNLKFCTDLSMLPVEVGHLTALKELLMDGTSVQEIPISIGYLKQLETMSASNCFSLCQLPRTICHLTNISLLSLDGTRITALPDSIGELVRLKHLSLRDCCQIRKLPISIGIIGRSLVELDLSGTGVVKFPDSLKDLQNLKVLRMDSCFFREFPPVIGELTSLEEIHASWCRSLKGGIPSEIGKLYNLRILKLRHSTISSIPAEIHRLSNLRTLDLLHCDMIKELPRLPSSITVLYVDDELKSSHLP
ncbi:hypothetical protein NL676_008063 [Syzygium grande]|nr:hypothetical protein NL676_008063 [Syzygium grande]